MEFSVQIGSGEKMKEIFVEELTQNKEYEANNFISHSLSQVQGHNYGAHTRIEFMKGL